MTFPYNASELYWLCEFLFELFYHYLFMPYSAITRRSVLQTELRAEQATREASAGFKNKTKNR